jgi:hypothetical protein
MQSTMVLETYNFRRNSSNPSFRPDPINATNPRSIPADETATIPLFRTLWCWQQAEQARVASGTAKSLKNRMIFIETALPKNRYQQAGTD